MPDVIEWRRQVSGELAARASDGNTYPTSTDAHGRITIHRSPLASVLCTEPVVRAGWPRPNLVRWEPRSEGVSS